MPSELIPNEPLGLFLLAIASVLVALAAFYLLKIGFALFQSTLDRDEEPEPVRQPLDSGLTTITEPEPPQRPVSTADYPHDSPDNPPF